MHVLSTQQNLTNINNREKKVKCQGNKVAYNVQLKYQEDQRDKMKKYLRIQELKNLKI
jgi:hypothetical protein